MDPNPRAYEAQIRSLHETSNEITKPCLSLILSLITDEVISQINFAELARIHSALDAGEHLPKGNVYQIDAPSFTLQVFAEAAWYCKINDHAGSITCPLVHLIRRCRKQPHNKGLMIDLFITACAHYALQLIEDAEKIAEPVVTNVA